MSSLLHELERQLLTAGPTSYITGDRRVNQFARSYLAEQQRSHGELKPLVV